MALLPLVLCCRIPLCSCPWPLSFGPMTIKCPKMPCSCFLGSAKQIFLLLLFMLRTPPLSTWGTTFLKTYLFYEIFGATTLSLHFLIFVGYACQKIVYSSQYYFPPPFFSLYCMHFGLGLGTSLSQAPHVQNRTSYLSSSLHLLIPFPSPFTMSGNSNTHLSNIDK